MNDEHIIALGKKITKLTDIYLQKKPELIELCKSKKLKSVGTVDNLRARLSRYYKGIVELDDIEETLSDQQKLKVQKDSTENRIDIKELLTQSNLSDSSPETSNSASNRPKTSDNDLLKISNILENNANKLITQADQFLNTGSNLYQNNLEQIPNNNYNNLINLDPNESTKIEHIYEDIESPIKTESNLNTTFFSNSKFVIESTPKKFNNLANQNPRHKMEKMIIKPDYFSGQGDVKHFFKQYEKAGLINSWDDSDKVKFLSIFLKGTAETFLENLENIKTQWTWVELKNEFLNEFQPIGYSILLKTKLENRKQEDTESIMSFVTDIENLCRQVERNMKEEDICTYILKGLKEPILNAISLHDNSTLKKLKENLKKYELMQFRVNSRSPGLNEYTEILNKQVMQLNTETKDSNQEIKRLNTKLEGIDNYYKNKIDQLCTEMYNLKKHDKTVNFGDRSRNRDKSPYPEKSDYKGRNNYREKSPYPDRYNDYKFRNNSREMSNNRDRSYSRDRKDSYDRSRDTSRNRYNNRNRGNDENRKQHSRDSSRERYSRSTTPEKFNGRENIKCYKCNAKGHYANDCNYSKNE